MNASPDVSTCANPECKSKFKRLGAGELFVFPVHDPKAWGLSPQIKQKVFWLCDGCCEKFHVRLDRKHHAAQIVHKPANRKVA